MRGRGEGAGETAGTYLAGDLFKVQQPQLGQVVDEELAVVLCGRHRVVQQAMDESMGRER
jgi:hypothetical protein